MTRLNLRRPRVEEADALSSLCLRSKAVWGYDEAFLEACRSELTLTPSQLCNGWFRVAEVEGEVLGLVQLALAGDTAELEKLFVRPESLNRGIGTALFAAAAEAARAAGAGQLVLAADPGAVPFYERQGARKAGKVPSGSIAGRWLPRMVLEL